MVELHLGKEADLIGFALGGAGDLDSTGGHVNCVTVAALLQNDVLRDKYAFIVARRHVGNIGHVEERKRVAGLNADAGITGGARD